jgi:hypothetical protein
MRKDIRKKQCKNPQDFGKSSSSNGAADHARGSRLLTAYTLSSKITAERVDKQVLLRSGSSSGVVGRAVKGDLWMRHLDC